MGADCLVSLGLVDWNTDRISVGAVLAVLARRAGATADAGLVIFITLGERVGDAGGIVEARPRAVFRGKTVICAELAPLWVATD